MKQVIYILAVISVVILSSCGASKTPKSEAYKGMYDEKPLTVLIMPPINRSTNVEAKQYFHSTLSVPLSNAGYYVVPPFLSMEILKRESAYDSEMFLEGSLNKFNEVFGADIAIFIIIHKWNKSTIMSKVNVDIEYIIKSTETNEVIYSRRGEIVYDTSIGVSGGGLIGAAVSMAASAVNTAATKYVKVARACNNYTLEDLPVGKYSPNYGQDGEEMAGKKEFTKSLN